MTEQNQTAREQRLEAALLRSMQAFYDLLNVAADLSEGERRVRARRRINARGGTLAYISDIQRQNRLALGDQHDKTNDRPIYNRVSTPRTLGAEWRRRSRWPRQAY